MKLNYLFIISLCVALTACTTSSGIIPDGKNEYRVMHTGDTGFTNSNTLQKNAYKEATAFCAGKGKIVKTVNMESKQARPLGGWPEANLLFKCENQNEVKTQTTQIPISLEDLKNNIEVKASKMMADANQHARCYVLAETMRDGLAANLHYAHGTYVLEKPYFDATANEERAKLAAQKLSKKDLESYAYERYRGNCKYLNVGQ